MKNVKDKKLKLVILIKFLYFNKLNKRLNKFIYLKN